MFGRGGLAFRRMPAMDVYPKKARVSGSKRRVNKTINAGRRRTLLFELSFVQPSCMRCNEHNKQVDFILDWCSCHSGGVLWSERARRRKPEPQNVSGQSSAALSHRRKLSYAHCCTNPRKRVLSLRTRSLFRFHIGVRLGRKPQWENFVCFLQCSMISDCPPGHASRAEVSKERFLEETERLLL